MAARKPKGSTRSAWVHPLGHDECMRGLWSAQAAGRLSHALLLTGAEGIGKFTMARWVAAGLLCAEGPGEPCLQCGPCKRLMAGNHPDFMEVDARANGLDALTVAFFAPRREARTSGYQGVSVGEFLSLRSAEGGARVVLVREAERMNGSAQNAFLKTLEEPSPGTHLILESSSSGVLLPTILSRVVQVPVAAPGPQVAIEVLRAQGMDGEDVVELGRLAQGSPGLALRYGRQSRPAMLGVLSSVAGGEFGPIEARLRLMDLPGKFEGKTPTAESRDRARCFLDLALAWLRDGERLVAGIDPAALAMGDHLQAFLGMPQVQRRDCLDRLLGIRSDVGLNLACETLLDRALLALAPRVASPSRA